MPLCVDTAMARTTHHHELHPGDALLLYTDGLIETPTASLTDGQNRLAREAARHQHLPRRPRPRGVNASVHRVPRVRPAERDPPLRLGVGQQGEQGGQCGRRVGVGGAGGPPGAVLLAVGVPASVDGEP